MERGHRPPRSLRSVGASPRRSAGCYMHLQNGCADWQDLCVRRYRASQRPGPRPCVEQRGPRGRVNGRALACVELAFGRLRAPAPFPQRRRGRPVMTHRRSEPPPTMDMPQYSAQAADRCAAADQAIAIHVESAASQRCAACDQAAPCAFRRAAEGTLRAYGRLPRRLPGATLRAALPADALAPRVVSLVGPRRISPPAAVLPPRASPELPGRLPVGLRRLETPGGSGPAAAAGSESRPPSGPARPSTP